VTTVLVLPLYHPVLLAEELATLDIVTQGRLVVGLGLGYRTSEFENLGIDFTERVGRFEEALAVMKRLWTERRVVHDGRFFTVDGEPHIEPWQRPYPPLWIGAEAPPGVRRAARFADAWPIGPNMPVERAAELMAVFAKERRRLDRPVGPQPIRRDVSFGADRASALEAFATLSAARYASYARNERPDYRQRQEDLAHRLIHGTVAQCIESVEQLARDLPVDPLIVRPHWPAMSDRELASYLDQLGELVAGVAGITSS
jgi:alkanesulfonate monooxygenase SsuD/methylene tetrahydromethanopterin reductase-like flavin-dependent oxidoreductase (luciferase family)